LKLPTVEEVSGLSSGAIAAVVYTHLGYRIHEYAERFLTDGGNALRHLRDMLHEEEAVSVSKTNHIAHGRSGQQPGLHIATTKCIDGSMKRWSFTQKALDRTISSWPNTEKIPLAVKAPCTIPLSFHPMDCISLCRSLSYPPQEGILMEDGSYYVDGGISAPAPTHQG
jgi:hypothetical protein